MGANELLAELAGIGRAGDGYTRLAWDPATMELREWFAGQVAALGLELVEDGNGNQVAWWRPTLRQAQGSFEGSAGRPLPELVEGSAARGAVDGTASRRAVETSALLLGSHLDSVPVGGPLDGPLGVASALAALAGLRAAGWRPSRPVAVANFSDEEGGRFGVACLGSRLATGAITPAAALALRGADGTTLAEAMAAQGRDPRAAGVARWLDEIGQFVELHVEQGRSLVHGDAAVGVASAIWPHGRWRFDFCGQGNHAGATAMADRRDPMLTYAATVLAARELAVAGGQRATVGRVQVDPGSTNSIPSRVTAWLDARAGTAPELEALVAGILARAEAAAALDGTTVGFRVESTTGAVEFDTALRHRLAALLDAPVLPTGAGHDAGILAARLPTAMLFVRNPTGISHAPEEAATPDDIDAGVAALTRVIRELA